MAKLGVLCRACGASSTNVTSIGMEAAGWRWTESRAVRFGGYWLCPACASTPEAAAAMVALRELA